MKTLITRTITGIVFAGLIVATFFTPPVFSHILFLLVALIGTREYLNLAKNQFTEPQFLLPFLIVAALLSAFQLMIYSIPLFLSLLMFTILLIFTVPVVELFRKKTHPFANIAASLFPVFWIALPFALTSMWMHYFHAASMVLALFIIIWLYDTLAYCAGSLFGKHPLFERISPKKSWEGLIISLVLTVAASIAFAHIPYFKSIIFSTYWHWMGFAFVIIVASNFGDLAESLLKRSAGVKDSGNILPGHGGILDRFDSFLFAAPVGLAYWLIFALK